MTLTLYQNQSEINYLNKSLSEIATVSAVLKNDTDISKPIIQLKSALPPNSNYCYIQAFGRYYFITSQKILPGGINELTLECDVLMSFKSTILASSVIAERSTNRCNKKLPDNIPLLAKRNVLYKKLIGGIGESNYFGSDKPGAANYSLLLTVINTRGTAPGESPVISFVETETPSEVKITWHKIADVSDYRVYRKGALDEDFTIMARVPATEAPDYIYSDILSIPGTYYYKVQAEQNQALGAFSNVLMYEYTG